MGNASDRARAAQAENEALKVSAQETTAALQETTAELMAETVLRDRPEYQVRGCRAIPRPGSPARMSGPTVIRISAMSSFPSAVPGRGIRRRRRPAASATNDCSTCVLHTSSETAWLGDPC